MLVHLFCSSNQLSLQCLQDSADAPVSEFAEEVMKIYLPQNQEGSVDEPTYVGSVIEDITLLSSFVNFSRACCYLLRLTHALDLRNSNIVLRFPVLLKLGPGNL